MTRLFNFSPGPATMPEAVLKQAQNDLLDWKGTGTSVMEMSHRGKRFSEISAKAEQDLRDLLSIPDNYHVLFLQGGATGQFSFIPMNLLGDKTQADYVNTGTWSKKASVAAEKYASINIVASSESDGFNHIPNVNEWQINNDSAYLHYVANETIGGVEFHSTPDIDLPLIVDMSSTILSRPVDVSKYGLIYAGAQKNIGPAGLTIVIVRDDLLGKAHPSTPNIFNYTEMVKTGSMLNTPPTFAWYMAGLVFEWLKLQGGVHEIANVNLRKSQKLYDAIDASDFFQNPVALKDRSWMNVPFILQDPELDSVFLKEADVRGLVKLKGHKSVGGMRASLYNALPEKAVDELIILLNDFEKQYG